VPVQGESRVGRRLSTADSGGIGLTAPVLHHPRGCRQAQVAGDWASRCPTSRCRGNRAPGSRGSASCSSARWPSVNRRGQARPGSHRTNEPPGPRPGHGLSDIGTSSGRKRTLRVAGTDLGSVNRAGESGAAIGIKSRLSGQRGLGWESSIDRAVGSVKYRWGQLFHWTRGEFDLAP
jgi:hypothetical protein